MEHPFFHSTLPPERSSWTTPCLILPVRSLLSIRDQYYTPAGQGSQPCRPSQEGCAPSSWYTVRPQRSVTAKRSDRPPQMGSNRSFTLSPFGVNTLGMGLAHSKLVRSHHYPTRLAPHIGITYSCCACHTDHDPCTVGKARKRAVWSMPDSRETVREGEPSQDQCLVAHQGTASPHKQLFMFLDEGPE